MSTAENALDQFNLVVERASKLAVEADKRLKAYLKKTKDSEEIRDQKSHHAEQLEYISESLTDFRKLFHQNLLAAIAQVGVAFDQDPELNSVIITVKKPGVKSTNGATYHIPVTLSKR